MADELVTHLSDLPFFEGFSDEELRRVAALAEPVDAEPGAVIVEQGRVGLDCYVLVDGTANVYVRGEFITTVEAGSMVGEMALVDHRPRSATVVAATETHMLRFGIDGFKELFEQMPVAHDRVMALLHARLPESGRVDGTTS